MFDGYSSVDVNQQYQTPLLSTPTTSSWLHTPPSQMPWSIPVANQPTVVRFTGDSYSPASARTIGISNPAFEMSCALNKPFAKRKSYDGDLECSPPCKQLLTEEKMAANLSGLHISSNYTAHQFGSSVEPESSAESSNRDAREGLPSLVMCEELRKLTSEPVIPPTLINKVERPTKALVVWQPPGGNICHQLQEAVKRASSQCLTKSNHVNSNNTMDQSEEEEEPKPSTSGLRLSTSGLALQARNNWADMMDNNNSSSAMDLNLSYNSRPGVPNISPLDIPLPEDSMMDL